VLRSAHLRWPLGLTLLIAIAVAGCKSAKPPTDFGVNLTIDASAVQDRGGLTTLRVDVTGEAQPYTHDFDVQKTIASTTLFHTHYVPVVMSGQLVFGASLLDGTGVVHATAATVATSVVAGKATEITLTLVASVTMMPDGGPDALPTTCSNGQMDPGESDVDCSGSCPKCEPGKMCNTADDCATHTCLAGHCELATATPGWVTVTALPSPRTAGAAAGRDDGTIWMIGGYSTMAEASTLSYSSATNDWSAGPALPQPRMQMPAVVAADNVFVIGGLTPINATMSDTLGSIVGGSGSTLAWNTLMRALATKRYVHGAALGSDGLIYVGAGFPAPAMPAVTDFVSFDPATDTTDAPTALAAMPSARSELGMAGDSAGHVVAFGGAGTDNMATASSDIYTITTKVWSSGPSLSAARRNPGAVMGADGRVYAIGGNDDAGASLAMVDALSLDGTRWSAVAPLDPPRTQVSVTRGWDGRIYAIGGQVGGAGALTPTTVVQAYGPRIVPGPAMGAPGTVVAVTGTNFAANATVTLTFSGDPPTTAPQTRQSNDTGQVAPSFVWTVPQVPSGTYTLTAVDDRSRYPVRARFVVP
jgi:hypothetical protein